MPLSPVTRRVLGNLPVRAALEADLASLVAQAAPVPEVKAGPDGLLLATLRSNLHAAARHIALGHAGPSFRDCAGPACIEAAKLIPELDPVQGAATDAELDAILDDVLISLEREGASFFAPKPS
jgi:hypothetical protein